MMKRDFNLPVPWLGQVIRTALIALTGLWLAMSACLAEDFRNLGFDEADATGLGIFMTDGHPEGITWTEALLPGWTLTQGLASLPLLPVNLERPDIDALLADARVFDMAQGRFALRLERFLTNSPLWRLEQSATVPQGVKYLVYRNEILELRVEVGSRLYLPLNRQSANGIAQYTPVATNLVYDISDQAGQEVKMAFVGPFPPSQPLPGLSKGGVSYIDSIRFVSASPELNIRKVDDTLVLSWPSTAFGYVLQERPLSDPQAPWSNVAPAPVVVETEQRVRVGLTNRAQIFRLGLE